MLDQKEKQAKKVLIFRQGSLGDTVVALPCFRLIRQFFSQAKLYVLTNKPINNKACALEMVLESTGLIDEYLAYPASCSFIQKIFIIRKLIKKLDLSIMIYLIERPTRLRVWRDYLFFKLCGVKKIIGLSLFGKRYDYLYDAASKRYEYEGKRLARQLEDDLGKVDWSNPAVMDLGVTAEERYQLQPYLPAWLAKQPFFVCSVGTKLEIKDWGQANWLKLMKALGEQCSECAMIFIGVENEYERSQALLDLWPGHTLNLCGKLSVRQSAAFLNQADIFIGHDSGPMHLAAAAGARCVAIFSRHNKPACWFPYGGKHQVVYPKGDSVRSISVSEVVSAVNIAVKAEQLADR